MIYSFAPTDKRKLEFLQILQSSGIDFEITEHDHSVVRVLGQVTAEIAQKIKDAGISAQSLALNRIAETNCYDLISRRSELTIIAGPCAVESAAQLELICAGLSRSGVKFLRGGAYKPRTKVDSFQGLGIAGLKLLRNFADRFGMYVVTEVMDRSQIDLVAEYADILQVGSRNMYNYTLLTALGSVDRPVLLKRGMSATLSEWYSAAEYVSRGGNERLILCERGIRTFEPEIAHTMDVAGIVLAKAHTGYPIIADTSHAAGRPDLVEPLAMAAVAAGADGIMIEVHPAPSQALSDGKQALMLPQFEQLATSARQFFAVRKSISNSEQD
ncbi:MAG: 3-deoxy-7-phosphoheptulonate synthase [Candidatus Zixiibacteriota bacterium]